MPSHSETDELTSYKSSDGKARCHSARPFPFLRCAACGAAWEAARSLNQDPTGPGSAGYTAGRDEILVSRSPS